MKLFWLLTLSILFTATKKSCKNKKLDVPITSAGCYKGKLEVKGGCMNYTISISGKNFDTALVMANWTDENTGKAYKNVFALNSRCTFPDTIDAGDEFYFVIDSTTVQNCAVCMMYYPVPPKKLSIRILQKPCP